MGVANWPPGCITKTGRPKPFHTHPKGANCTCGKHRHWRLDMIYLLHLASEKPNFNLDVSIKGSFQIAEGLVQLGPNSQAMGKTYAIVEAAKTAVNHHAKPSSDIDPPPEVVVVMDGLSTLKAYRSEIIKAGARGETPISFKAYVQYAVAAGRKLIVFVDEVSRERLGDEWNSPVIIAKAGWAPRGPVVPAPGLVRA